MAVTNFNDDNDFGGGGGGATFVYTLAPLKLLVAAGGGGGATVPYDGVAGQNTSSGTSSIGSVLKHGKGGINGEPGTQGFGSGSGGAGAGWMGSNKHDRNGQGRLKVTTNLAQHMLYHLKLNCRL